MKAFTQFWDMSKRNKLFVAVVVLLCFGVIELTTHFFSKMEARITGGNGQVVAVVQTVQTDVRQKPVEEPSWYRAEPQADIVRGDAIYSGGRSHAMVKMQSGGILELGEETLVIFDDVDGVTIPDVTQGSVKIKISGGMKIAISGEVTEFSGSQSEFEINADGTRGNIRATKGKVSVGRKGASVRNLLTGQEMELVASPDHKVPSVQVPKASELISEVRLGQKRKPDVVLPVIAPTSLPVVEVSKPVATPVPVPVAQLVAVAPPVPTPMPEPAQALSVQNKTMQVDRVMRVEEVYERRGKRALVPRTGVKFLKVPVALQWNGAKPDEKVRVQVSKDKSFAKPWTEREATGKNLVVEQWKPGQNYWRVSRDGQTWSQPAEINVRPKVAIQQNPSVSVFKNKLVVNAKGQGIEAQAKLRFQDSGIAKPRGWVLQGSNTPTFQPEKTRTVYVSEPRVDIPISKPGKYYFRVRSVASAGEISAFSAPTEISAVKAAAPPVQIRMAQKQKPKERQVAAIDDDKAMKESLKDELAETPKQTARMRTLPKEHDVYKYHPWSVTIEGGETALVSSEQIAGGNEPASIHVLGMRGQYNNGRHAAWASYHAKFGGANAQGSAQGNSRLEGRYTRWWQTGHSWLRLGWAGGLESFNNSASTQFSKGYTAAKTGLGVDMRFGDRWSTGGDILAGAWTDANRVYEFGGFLSYDFTQELAFGVGYRLSLFEAGNAASAPISLPYREAMGEAYSSLKFSF